MMGREGYDTIGSRVIIRPIRLGRVDKWLKKMYQDYTILSDEEIKMELEKEDSTNYKSMNND
jgi:hypothetical protein